MVATLPAEPHGVTTAAAGGSAGAPESRRPGPSPSGGVPAPGPVPRAAAEAVPETDRLPSPGLCQLLNAAAIDPVFCGQLLAAPAATTSWVAYAPHLLGPERLRGNPALALPALQLTAADWALLEALPPMPSLREMWLALRSRHTPARDAREEVHGEPHGDAYGNAHGSVAVRARRRGR